MTEAAMPVITLSRSNRRRTRVIVLRRPAFRADLKSILNLHDSIPSLRLHHSFLTLVKLLSGPNVGANNTIKNIIAFTKYSQIILFI